MSGATETNEELNFEDFVSLIYQEILVPLKYG